jgi:hypothetical protein
MVQMAAAELQVQVVAQEKAVHRVQMVAQVLMVQVE